MENPSQEEIQKLLKSAKRIAVVGMSSKPERASNMVSKMLIELGYEVLPVHPKEKEIHGLKVYPSLDEIDGQIDIVDVFLRSELTDMIIDKAIEKKAGTIWLQESVTNDEGGRRAKEAGMAFLQDICIAKELRKM